MSTIIVKSKGKSTIETYKSLDGLRKRCMELKSLIAKGKVEILGVSYDDEDEKTIFVNNKIIDIHKKEEER